MSLLGPRLAVKTCWRTVEQHLEVAASSLIATVINGGVCTVGKLGSPFWAPSRSSGRYMSPLAHRRQSIADGPKREKEEPGEKEREEIRGGEKASGGGVEAHVESPYTGLSTSLFFHIR